MQTNAKSYSRTEKHACTVVSGQLPLRDMATLLQQAAPGSIMDPQAANMLGATLVFGTPANLAKLKADPEVVAMALERENQVDRPGVSPQLRQWLAIGERGASSESMVSHLLGLAGLHEGEHPHDMDDFRRCRLLVEQVPELAAKIEKLSPLSPEWAGIAPAWSQICDLMDRETPEWRSRTGNAKGAAQILRDAIAAGRQQGGQP